MLHAIYCFNIIYTLHNLQKTLKEIKKQKQVLGVIQKDVNEYINLHYIMTIYNKHTLSPIIAVAV